MPADPPPIDHRQRADLLRAHELRCLADGRMADLPSAHRLDGRADGHLRSKRGHWLRHHVTHAHRVLRPSEHGFLIGFAGDALRSARASVA